MKVGQRKLLINALSQVLGVAVLGSAAVALAQQAQKIEKIEVTGSNIKRVDAEGPAPVQIISREEIARSTAPTVGDLLRRIPSNSGGSYSESSTNNQSGAAGISLRGLGQKSTLVLINGRRMANHAFAQNNQDTFVDLHSIPKSAVDRIEILKDGASAIYGSDAIAGVVNVILRRDYTGLEVAANAGQASEGGLNEQGASVSFGRGDLDKDGYNVLAVLDYFHRDRMMLSDRAFLNNLDFRNLPGGYWFPAMSGGTWVRPSGVTGLPSRTPLNPCQPGARLIPYSVVAGSFGTGNTCGYDFAPYGTAFPEADRVGFFSRGTLRINADVQAFAEMSVSRNESNWINQPQTMTNTTVRFNPATGGFIPFSNVFPANFANNPYGRPASLNYTFFDVGARTFDLTTDAFRVLTGLSGTWRGWDWQAAVGTSESKISQLTGGQVDADVLAGFIANPTSGQYNFLAPTPEQTARLRLSTTRNSSSKLSFLDAKASTELAQLPAGPLGFAAGVELRTESMKDVPDEAIRQGRLLGTGSSATDGKRDAIAGFFEFSMPALKSLELQLAGRGDHYSDFGSAFSPKAGAKWSPIKEVLVRASYAKGFRAPTLVENSNSNSLSFTSLRDPARNGATSIVGVVSLGAKDLKPEKSDSYTLGLVLEPTKHVSFGLDYYHIEQKNLVSQNGFQFIVNNPTFFPGAVVRDPATNQIVVVYDNYTNIAKVETSGIDFDASLKLPETAVGKFAWRTNWSYLIDYQQPPAAGAEPVDYAGRNAGPNGLVLPRVRGTMALDWNWRDFQVTLSGNYTGHYRQRSASFPVPPANAFVGDHTTFDLYFAYTGVRNLKVWLAVTNLADRDPPIDIASGVGPEPTLYDLRSRYYRVGLEYKFK